MEKEYQKELCSKTIDFVRFPLAVMVVFIHSCFGKTDVMSMDFSNLTSTNVYDLIRITFSHAIPRIAVPTFFLISGYLFFVRLSTWDWSVWRKKMKSRFHTLVIPFFLWCTLYVCKQVLLKWRHDSPIIEWFNEKGWLHLLWDSQQWGGDFTNWFGGLEPHSTSPALYPMWFLRDLIVVVTLTPIIYWAIKKTRGWFVAVVGLFYISNVWIDIHGLGCGTLFYFSLGAVFSIYNRNLTTELAKIRIPSYILAFILLCILIRYDGKFTPIGNFFHPFYVIFGVISAINISRWLIESGRCKVNRFLTDSCFFVFAFHVFILQESKRLVYKLVGDDGALLLTVRYFLTPVIAITLCLAVYYVLRRCFPWISRTLNGGR